MTKTHDFIKQTELNPKLKIEDLDLSEEEKDWYAENLNIKEAIIRLKLELRVIYALQDAENGDLKNSMLELWLLAEKLLQNEWNKFIDTLR